MSSKLPSGLRLDFGIVPAEGAATLAPDALNQAPHWATDMVVRGVLAETQSAFEGAKVHVTRVVHAPHRTHAAILSIEVSGALRQWTLRQSDLGLWLEDEHGIALSREEMVS